VISIYVDVEMNLRIWLGTPTEPEQLVSRIADRERARIGLDWHADRIVNQSPSSENRAPLPSATPRLRPRNDPGLNGLNQSSREGLASTRMHARQSYIYLRHRFATPTLYAERS
jgi:hypothetical protein